MAGCCQTMSAQDALVFPPAGLPEEIWKMSYADYRKVSHRTPVRDHERYVTFVWDENSLYIKGIYSDYPDSWIKGSVNGKEVSFEQNQLICELDTSLEEPKPVYSYNGIVGEFWNRGDSQGDYIYFFPNGAKCNGYTMYNTFTLRMNGRYIQSENLSSYKSSCKTAFWYNTGADILSYKEGNEKPYYPEMDFPMKILFEKIRGGVSGVSDDGASSESVIYDLYGRRVNPDNLRPGIYIRNGEKILVQ